MEAKKNNLKTISATLRNLQITPRKVRLVADLVRKKSIRDALIILEATPQKSAKPLHKLFRSAISNATINAKIPFDHLTIGSLMVGDARRLKRIRPRAKGVSFPVWKRYSHIFLKFNVAKPENPSITSPDESSSKKPFFKKKRVKINNMVQSNSKKPLITKFKVQKNNEQEKK